VRHAQEHWLRLPANPALAKCADCAHYVTVATENWLQAPVRKHFNEELRKEYARVIKVAAEALMRAEIIHREIVRRGGRP